MLRGLFYTSAIDAECVHWDQLFVTRVVLHICCGWRGRARDFAVPILYIIVLSHVDADFCIDSEGVQWVSCLLRGLFCTSVTDSEGMQGVSCLLRGLFYTLVGCKGCAWSQLFVTRVVLHVGWMQRVCMESVVCYEGCSTRKCWMQRVCMRSVVCYGGRSTR